MSTTTEAHVIFFGSVVYCHLLVYLAALSYCFYRPCSSHVALYLYIFSLAQTSMQDEKRLFYRLAVPAMQNI